MKISENQVFNLMDTNGRRKDVINALQGYLVILDNINEEKMQWKCLPDSLAQFEFYKQAIEMFPDTFKTHTKYDKLILDLQSHPKLESAINSKDIDWIRENSLTYRELLSRFDEGIEDRARHYTSTLVKLGFVDNNRNISDVGMSLLRKKHIHRDPLEEMLPLDDINIIYLRQLLKLRVFTQDGERFYSPFCMALYILLKKKRITAKNFFEIIQCGTPYEDNDLDSFIEKHTEGTSDFFSVSFPHDDISNDELLSFVKFRKLFINRKSKEKIDIYYNFYKILYNLKKSKSNDDLIACENFYKKNKIVLDKAFGYEKNLLLALKNKKITVTEFFKKEGTILFSNSFNLNFFNIFKKSKFNDTKSEYADTTKRIFKATGIISFDNGFVELAHRELCSFVFNIDKIKNNAMGYINEEMNANYDSYGEYEVGNNSFFCTIQSITDILEISKNAVDDIYSSIAKKYGETDIKKIRNLFFNRQEEDFNTFVNNKFPENRVKYLLSLFSDRSNDEIIRTEVCPDSSVPTIYEYIVGLAWYYFSNKKINLLKSFNLTLSADFEPLVHAGGGNGDIVIYEKNSVIMLEVTLMNANSQKRGEWEPVLRHSINLKIKEEDLNTDREVTTFFIADSFDANTINIWKAVSSIPLQSSSDKSKFTDNVIVMPISNNELLNLIDKKDKYDSIIKKIRSLFIQDISSFDKNWRNRFIKEIE